MSYYDLLKLRIELGTADARHYAIFGCLWFVGLAFFLAFPALALNWLFAEYGQMATCYLFCLYAIPLPAKHNPIPRDKRRVIIQWRL